MIVTTRASVSESRSSSTGGDLRRFRLREALKILGEVILLLADLRASFLAHGGSAPAPPMPTSDPLPCPSVGQQSRAAASSTTPGGMMEGFRRVFGLGG